MNIVSNLFGRIRKLKQHIEELETENKQLDKDITIMLSDISSYQDEIKELEDACTMKDKRVDWTVTDNAKKAIKIKELEDALKELCDSLHNNIGYTIYDKIVHDYLEKLYRITQKALEDK